LPREKPKLLFSRSLKTVTSTPILCGEDSETYLPLRKAVLTQAGYVVFTATTPSEAMEILREAPVCLVLSDHMLRGATGTALATEMMKKIKPDVPDYPLLGKYARNDAAHRWLHQ